MKAMNNLLRFAQILSLVAATVGLDQEPNLVNANVQILSADADLLRTFRNLVQIQGERAWIGYAVRAVPGHRRICCESATDRHLPSIMRKARCKLEGHNE